MFYGEKLSFYNFVLHLRFVSEKASVIMYISKFFFYFTVYKFSCALLTF